MEHPKALITYCILSWIYMGYYLIDNILKLINGPMTAWEMRGAKLELLRTITPENRAFMKETMQGTIDMMERTNESLYVIEPLNLMAFVIGILGVYMMYNLRKLGYFLYLIYSVIPVGLAIYFLWGNPLGNIGVVSLSFFTVLFVILYGTQLKNLK